MKKFIYFAAAALVFAGAASCEQNGGETDITNPYDEQFAKIADRFVNETVIPTYEALSTSTAELETLLQQLKEDKSQATLEATCEKFLEARAWWEKSEAFLFGPATDFGVDPHIDSWPLDVDALNMALSNTDQINAMNGEGGDQFAGDNLGNTVLGFHGIVSMASSTSFLKTEVLRISPISMSCISSMPPQWQATCATAAGRWNSAGPVKTESLQSVWKK